jgi:ribonucleoside-diphosphate reductase alpha chain
MPTASTSQILGKQEAFEPYTSNIIREESFQGEFIVVNKHLLQRFSRTWFVERKRNKLMRNNGSVQA